MTQPKGSNMSERKKSWAEMTDRNSEWFTWTDILTMTAGKREVTLRVVKATQGHIKQSKNKRVVALKFEGAKNPLGLNPTNAAEIESLYGTDKPADWEAQRILLTLYIGRTKDPKRPGQECNCVRIRNRKPSPAEVHGAKYDREIALAMIGGAGTEADLTAARAALTALKPPAADADALRAAIAEADKRIKAAAEAAEAAAREAAELDGFTPDATDEQIAEGAA